MNMWDNLKIIKEMAKDEQIILIKIHIMMVIGRMI